MPPWHRQASAPPVRGQQARRGPLTAGTEGPAGQEGVPQGSQKGLHDRLLDSTHTQHGTPLEQPARPKPCHQTACLSRRSSLAKCCVFLAVCRHMGQEHVRNQRVGQSALPCFCLTFGCRGCALPACRRQVPLCQRCRSISFAGRQHAAKGPARP